MEGRVRVFCFVLVPFLVQLAGVLGIIALTNGTGSFVGLAALALGVWVLPITALINWVGSRQPGNRGDGRLIVRTVLLTVTFPALLLALHLAVR